MNLLIPWTRLAGLLELPVRCCALPTRLTCPLCDGPRLEIHPDLQLGGQWFWCRDCARFGDMIELASLAWQLPVPAAIRKLGHGLELPFGEPEIHTYVKRYVDRRHRLADLWEQARQRLLNGNTTAYRLIHQFGLACDVSPERLSAGPGRILGACHVVDIDRLLLHESAFTVPGREGERLQTFFRGRGWGDILVWPFYDLPGRMCGVGCLGREGDLAKDYLWMDVLKENRGTAPLREAGLSFHPEALEAAGAWQDRVIAVDSVVLATQLQSRQFERSGRPLPLVAWHHDPASQKIRYETSRLAWRGMLGGRQPVFWLPFPKRPALAMAIRLGAMVSLVGPQRAQDLDAYIRGMPPQDLAGKIFRGAQPWPEAVARLVRQMEDPAVEALFLSLALDSVDLHRVQEACDPPLRARLQQILTRGKVRGMVFARGATIFDDDAGLHVAHHAGKTPPERLVSAIPWIERIAHQPRAGRTYYCGHVVDGKNSWPFAVQQWEMEKDTYGWLDKFLIARGSSLLRSPHAGPCRSLTALVRELRPPITTTEPERVGWDPERLSFVFPRFEIDSRGEIRRPDIEIFDPEAPGWCYEPPEPLTPQPIEEALEDAPACRLAAALVTALLTNILAPACHADPGGVALVGDGAAQAGRGIAEGLGCWVVPLRDNRYIGQAHSREAAHAWPCCVDVRCRLTPRNRRVWLGEPGSRTCLAALTGWEATAAAAEGGWCLIPVTCPPVFRQSCLAAWRKILPAYLQDVARRNFHLRRWRDQLEWPVAVLQDFQAFLAEISPAAERLGAVDELWRPDTMAGRAEAVAAVLARLVATGELPLVPEAFQGPGASIVQRADRALAVRPVAILGLLEGHGTTWYEPEAIATALTAQDLLRVEGDWWVFPEEWLLPRLRRRCSRCPPGGGGGSPARTRPS